MIAGAVTGTEFPVVTLPFLVGAATGVGAGTDTGDATGGDTGASIVLHENSIFNSARKLSKDGQTDVRMFSNVSLERKFKT